MNQCHIKWTSCSDLPCKLYDASIAVSDAGDAVYVTAGNAPDDKTYDNVYRYTTHTDQWTVLPQPGHLFGVLHMLDDRLTIFGGQDPATHKSHNKVTTYNNDTNSWYSQYPDMINIRSRPGVITYDNYVIVMGGKNNSDIILDRIEVMEYHDQLQWKEIPVYLPVPMWCFKPTISGDKIIIVGYSTAGGRSNGHYQISTDEIISFLDQPLTTDVVSAKWKMLQATHYDTVTVPNSNPPIIIGGCNQGLVCTSDVTLYDVSKDSWRKVDSLTNARDYAGVNLINERTLIVIGGTSGGADVKGAMASSLTLVEIGNIVLNF